MSTVKVIESIAEKLGLDPTEVKIGNGDWVRMMKSGVLAELHIGRWRAVSRLSLDDLGIDFIEGEEGAEDLIRLGEKYLLPPAIVKELNAVDTGARKVLEKYSFKTFWGNFLDAESFAVWKDENENFKARYFAIRDRIVSDYQDIRGEILAEYAKAARAAYRRKMAIDAASMTAVRGIAEDIFVERFVDRVLGLIPSAREISESFHYDVEYRFVPLPSLLEEDALETDRIRNRRTAERELSDAEIAMKREVVEAARRQKDELIGGFMKDVVSQLTTKVYEAATDILDTTSKNGNLHPRSVVQLQTLISRVRSMNFFGYEDVEKMLSQAESILDRSPDARNVKEIVSKFEDIATITRATLLGLGERPRSARRIGVSDNPTPSMVRKARGRLGMDVEDVEVLPEMRSARIVEETI